MTAIPNVRARLTQEERSAKTRRKVIDAAIRCLHERGYAATTTTAVAEAAGVSRGAMFHQYATRVDLMIGVVQAVKADEFQYYLERLDTIADPREKFFAIPTIMWELGKRPEGMALIEIQVGSRSDRELAELLGPVQRRIDEDEAAERARIMAQLGIAELLPDQALTQMVIATIRGLVIERAFSLDPDALDASVERLRAMLVTTMAPDTVGR